MTSNSPKKIQSVSRALSVLSVVSEEGPISASLIAQRTGLAFATVQRLLHTLSDAGWVRRRITENTYEVPFTRVKQLVMQNQSRPLAECAVDLMKRAHQDLKLPIFLGGIRGLGTVEILETTLHLSASDPSDTLYGMKPSLVFGPLGLAPLAFMPDDLREKHLDEIRQNGPQKERLWIETQTFQESLKQIRAQGFATRHPDYAEEIFEDGSKMSVVGVPIIGDTSVLGALAFAWLNDRITMDQAIRRVPKLRGYADKIGAKTSKVLSI